MLPLAGKSILECIIESVASEGFNDVIVTTNYFREQIIDYFGNGSYLDHCIVAEKCNVGPNVEIEEMSIVGAGCEIGASSKLCKGSRIWPKIRIAQNSVVEDFVKH